jgi:hypothetical protein
VNILGNVAGTVGSCGLTYRLEAGAPRCLTIGPDDRRLQRPGDFNIDIPTSQLEPGDNRVTISLAGGQTKTVTVRWRPEEVGRLLTVDWAGQIDDLVHVVDGKWEVASGEARTVETGYDRALAIGDSSWTEYEVTVPVRFVGVGTPGRLSGGPLIGFGLRWLGHGVENANDQPHVGFSDVGAFAWYRLPSGGQPEDGGRLQVSRDGRTATHGPGMVLEQSRMYHFKASVQTIAGGGRYRFKVWEQGTQEPAYQVSVDDTDGVMGGSILLLAHHFDVRFGDVTVTPL